MAPTKAIEVVMKHPKGSQGVWLCEDDGDIGNFSNDVLASKVKSQDWAFFKDEYPRFLARVEGLGLGFQTPGHDGHAAPINFSLLYEVCDCIQEMPAGMKSDMMEQLKIYRVNRGDQEIELDRMKMIVSQQEVDRNFGERRKLVCRFLLAMFCHEFLFEMDQIKNIPIPYANYLFDLVKADDSPLIDLIGQMKKDQMLRVVEFFNNQIALTLADADNGQLTPDVILYIRVLEYFHRANGATHRLQASDFVNEVLSDKLNMKLMAALYYTHKRRPPSADKPFLILEYPFLFSTEAKVDVLQEECAYSQQSEIISQINAGLQQGNFANLLNPQQMHLNVVVRRSNVLEDALAKLSGQGKNLKKPLKVAFAGEAGVDAGGVRKEFFGLLVKELFNPMYAMFTVKNVGTAHPGPVLLVQPGQLRGTAQLRAGRHADRSGDLQLGADGPAAASSGLQEADG